MHETGFIPFTFSPRGPSGKYIKSENDSCLHPQNDHPAWKDLSVIQQKEVKRRTQILQRVLNLSPMSSANLKMFFESSLQSELKVVESDISVVCKVMVESLCEDLLSMPRADASVCFLLGARISSHNSD